MSMETKTTNDLLQRNDSVAVNHADLAELSALCQEHGIHIPDHDGVQSISYNEKLTDEGLEGEFLWGQDRVREEWENRLTYPEFKRRLLNTLPMLVEAKEKRGHWLYLKLAKQRAAYAATCIRRFKREPDNKDHLKDALRVLGEIKDY